MKKIVKILAQAYFNICSKGASAFTPCKNKMLMQAASVFLLLLKKKQPTYLHITIVFMN